MYNNRKQKEIKSKYEYNRANTNVSESMQSYRHLRKDGISGPFKTRGSASIQTMGLKPRFEELGYNYGFTTADPEKNSGYCLVYRTLKEKMDMSGAVTRIKADENEVRLTELEGPFHVRDRVKIFTNDIISYYKFNHRSKFVAICIDANRKEKTGFWFLSFGREGQLNAFCDYLNWLFGLDSTMNDDEFSELNYADSDYISCVDQRTGKRQSMVMNEADFIKKTRGMDDRISDDSGYTDSETDFFSTGTKSFYRIPPRSVPYSAIKRDYRRM